MAPGSVKSAGVSALDVVVRVPDMVSASIDEVTALMSIEESRYFLLDKGGAMIWERIAEPIRVSDLCAALVREYAITQGDCERDVLEFLSGLLERNAIRIQR